MLRTVGKTSPSNYLFEFHATQKSKYCMSTTNHENFMRNVRLYPNCIKYWEYILLNWEYVWKGKGVLAQKIFIFLKLQGCTSGAF